MKRNLLLTFVVLSGLSLAIGGCTLASDRGLLSSELPAADGVSAMSNPQTGNGAPSGPHYTLNLIGVERGHENEQAPNSGRVIFVQLYGNCQIGLQEGDFQVLDRSCLDGDRAEFSLPDPADSDGDGLLQYSVYVRALTKGSAKLNTCYTDLEGNTFCNAGELIIDLKKVTPPKFSNVSKALLQVCVDTDPDPLVEDLELVPLFSEELQDLFWNYENDGLRLAQLRFYELQTTEQGGDCTRQ